MIKKTLRTLRQLNATKEMMQKAKADKPTVGNKWWKIDVKYPTSMECILGRST